MLVVRVVSVNCEYVALASGNPYMCASNTGAGTGICGAGTSPGIFVLGLSQCNGKPLVLVVSAILSPVSYRSYVPVATLVPMALATHTDQCHIYGDASATYSHD